MKFLLAASMLAAMAAAPAFAQPPTAQAPAQDASDPAPKPQTSVVVDTDVTTTPTATVETKTEVIKPVAQPTALANDHPIAPEVKAVAASKTRYTTADLVKAQHDAMMATPVSEPTTVIVTKTTTPNPTPG